MFFSRAPRHPVQFTAVYDDGERYLTAPVTNLSDSGLFIETSAPPKPGAEVHVIPLLPPSRGLPELEGVVVRVQDGKAELGIATPMGIGIMFKTLGDADAVQLKEFCDALKAESPTDSPTDAEDAEGHENLVETGTETEVDAKADTRLSKTRSKKGAKTDQSAKGQEADQSTDAPEPIVGYKGLSLKRAAKPKSDPSSKKGTQKKASPAPAHEQAASSAAKAEKASGVGKDASAATSAKKKKSNAAKAAPVESKDAKAPSVPADPQAEDKVASPSVAPDADLPLIASDDAELVEGTAENPILLSRTSNEPVLLEQRKSSSEGEPRQEEEKAQEEQEEQDATTEVQARSKEESKTALDAPYTDERSAASAPIASVADAPAEQTDVVRSRAPVNTQQVAFDDLLDSDLDQELGAILPQRGNGLLVFLGVLNIFAVGGALAYGAYRLDEVNHQQTGADTRMTSVGQDLAALGHRQKTLATTVDNQGKTLTAIEAVVLSEPTLEQSLTVEAAGVAGRFALQTRAVVGHEGDVDGEVVFATRRILVGDLVAVAAAPGKIQPLNSASQKGKVAWTVLEEEQLLSDGAKLSAFKSLSKKDRSALKKGAKIGDIVGALPVGSQREESRQLILDLPQGGLITVETEVGLLIDDKALVLKNIETRGVAATVVAP